MQDERTCEPSLVEASRSEGVVMLMLLHGGHWWPWSMGEVAQELGDEALAVDAVAGLHAAGLVHRFDEFVLPTRPATRMRQLEDALLTHDSIREFGPGRT
jgi:hypothetical protein